LEVYDCLRDTWMTGAALNTPRRNCSAVQMDGRIFAIGGFDGAQILSSVEAYDPRMKSWMSVAEMNTPRSSAMVSVQDGKLWCLGGTCGTRLRSVEWFEPRLNKWEPFKVDMIEVRSASQACTCVNHLYALGGTDNQQTIHYSLECLDPETLAWSFRKNMQVARMDFGCTVISDSIMVGGGQNGDVLSSTEFYRPELDEWQPGPSMMFPRYGHQYLLMNL